MKAGCDPCLTSAVDCFIVKSIDASPGTSTRTTPGQVVRIAILGRSGTLLRTAQLLASEGFDIPLVGTCLPPSYDGVAADDFAAFARTLGGQYFCDNRINRAEILDTLRQARCDVALSLDWISLIGAEACSLFPHGVLNVHAGDLPRYRGNACPNWAILSGETRIGLTVHRMHPGELDAGPVLLKDFFPIDQATYISDVYRWLAATVPTLCLKAMNQLRDGTASFKAQDSDQATWLRCYPRRPEDGLIHWNRPAPEIHRLVRATSHPFDGAFTYLEGSDLVRVWRADLVTHRGAFLAVPGQVMRRTEDGLVIACGDGTLSISDIEVSGLRGAEARARVGKSLRNRLTGPARA